jgi:hypothetical protein
MNLCNFENNVCVTCGRAKLNKRQACGRWAVNQKPRPGLGDMVAAGLSAVGITKDRVSAVVGGDCGCAERQDWLNRLGHRLGIGGPLDEPAQPPD